MQAFYYGCWDGPGHYLHNDQSQTLYSREYKTANGSPLRGPKHRYEIKGLPWGEEHMDAGLLKNGRRPDIYDGKLYWTCGGAGLFWFAFFWWDNSIDTRPGSNSGFYVEMDWCIHNIIPKGEQIPQSALKAYRDEALAYACKAFPGVIARQRVKLEVQE
jgi:hypothetical protein